MLTRDDMRRAILALRPELSTLRLTFHEAGFDSVAVEANGKLIFKFPRHRGAEAALRREARLLEHVRPAVSLATPDLMIHQGPPLLSCHTMLPGRHLLAADYALLGETHKDALAEELARFFAELHAIDDTTMREAGAKDIAPWCRPETMMENALPLLPQRLRAAAREIVREWASLPADPHGRTYGFFDGHGWNMAFDHARSRLNGIYDFADSGFGDLQQEFVYPNFISRDLTSRIIAGYERQTGRVIDRRRVEVLSGALRLHELAQAKDHAALRQDVLDHASDWFER